MKKRSKLADAAPRFAMVLPALFLYIVFVIYPLCGGVYYSMTDWDGIRNSMNFIWFDNYITLFQDTSVITPLLNTIKYAAVTTILMNVLALLFAIGLDHEFKTKNLLRACMFLPALLSPLVVGFIFSFIYSQPLADIGEQLGITVVANNLLGSTTWSLWAATFAATWRMTGWYMVVYLAGLQAIPGDLYEAADLDGVTPWKRFTQITFPLIAPSFTINMVLAVERAFKEYDMVYSLTNGGPGNSSELLALTIYQESFTNYRVGYGSAIGVILFLMIVAITLFQMIWLRKREDNAAY
ncbi:MAG: sugar ABC transporter permease [Faecalibacterium sp.]